MYTGRFSAFLDALDKITILIPQSYRPNERLAFMLFFEGQRMGELIVDEVIQIEHYTKYICTAPFEVPLGEEYQIEDDKGMVFALQTGAVIRTPEFDELYHYDGDDLGANYTEKETQFKIWAPTATNVKLKLINEFGTEKGTIPMNRGEKGVWSLTIHQNLENHCYSFLVRVNYIWREATDPYARAVSVNGQYSAVIDLSKYVKHDYSLPKLESPVDAIIYETHVRDFSHHHNSGMNAKGKYAAFKETDTRTAKGYSSGVHYLKELGVTHIELLPVNDFSGVDETVIGREYNWGYNPRHYFAPAGNYSANPHLPGKRIEELKGLIESVHNHGLGVIVDVVFNHVFQKEISNFEKIVPGYYFRYDANGMPSNGSGCGNDLASERFMVRKLIVSAVKYWLEFYQIDGFRFDLMGLLDIETMKEVEKTIHAIKPDAIIIGEGWDLPTALSGSDKATIENSHKLNRVGFFNDKFRDSIKGSNFNLKDTGYVSGKALSHEDFYHLVLNIGQDYPLGPEQSVNFVECHDNHTLWDRLQLANGAESNELRKRRHRFATSIVILSQGIPFLHSGQEFFRTKHGIENSYCSPDWINELNWDLREQNEETISYLRCLMAIRKSHGAFRFRSRRQIEKHASMVDISPACHSLLYDNVGEYGKWNRILVIYHHGEQQTVAELPGDKMWGMICGECGFTADQGVEMNIKDFTMEPLTTYVLVQE